VTPIAGEWIELLGSGFYDGIIKQVQVLIEDSRNLIDRGMALTLMQLTCLILRNYQLSNTLVCMFAMNGGLYGSWIYEL
jgi:hypothetical protein